MFLYYTFVRILDESLRWLIANGKRKKARILIRKAARINKVDIDDLIDQQQKATAHGEQITYVDRTQSSEVESVGFHVETTSEPDTTLSMKLSPLHILKNRHLLVTSLIMWYTWYVRNRH